MTKFVYLRNYYSEGRGKNKGEEFENIDSLQQRIPTSAVNITQPLLKKAHFVGFLLWKEAFVIDSMITGDWTGLP